LIKGGRVLDLRKKGAKRRRRDEHTERLREPARTVRIMKNRVGRGSVSLSGAPKGARAPRPREAPGAAVTFVDQATANSKVNGVALLSGTGNLNAGEAHAIWIRRTAANTALQANDGATLNMEGDVI
jgi:hypothetical protein